MFSLLRTAKYNGSSVIWELRKHQNITSTISFPTLVAALPRYPGNKGQCSESPDCRSLGMCQFTRHHSHARVFLPHKCLLIPEVSLEAHNQKTDRQMARRCTRTIHAILETTLDGPISIGCLVLVSSIPCIGRERSCISLTQTLLQSSRLDSTDFMWSYMIGLWFNLI